MNKNIDVLMVDDDLDYCELAVAALDACGKRTILCVHDGTDALDYLRGQNQYSDRDVRHQPRLVLLDLKLVKIDGLEVLKQMRAEPATRNVPVVMLSGADDQDALRACYDAGANSVVRKTTDNAELGRKIRGIFEFWLNVNEQNRESRV
jgi:CheY-like chemotaxis protein